MIEGVILAAGRGNRMLELTVDRPKCLVTLDGQPLLAWQLAALRGGGVSRVSIVGGYRAEMLKGFGINVIPNPDWSGTNMVASFLCACDVLPPEATLIVSYSDIIYSKDHISRLLAGKGDIVITYDRQWLRLWKQRFVNPLDDAEGFRMQNGRVIAIGGRARNVEEIGGQYMGLLKLSPAGIQAVRTFLSSHDSLRATLDMTGLLQLLIADKTEVHGVPVEGGWCEIDRASDLEIARNLLASGELNRLTR